MAADRTTWILMAKDPRPGHVKTRLTPPLSPDEAAELALTFVADLGERLARLPGRLTVALPPGDAPDRLARVLSPAVEFVSQGPGHLGQRLDTVLGRVLNGGATRALVLGSDHPHLPQALLMGALRAARDGQVGWIPTRDGGYACLALTRPIPELFEDVPWTTSGVAEATRNNARRIGVSLVAPGEWYDLDTADDLRRLCRDPDSAARCPRTMTFLRRLGFGTDREEEIRDG